VGEGACGVGERDGEGESGEEGQGEEAARHDAG